MYTTDRAWGWFGCQRERGGCRGVLGGGREDGQCITREKVEKFQDWPDLSHVWKNKDQE